MSLRDNNFMTSTSEELVETEYDGNGRVTRKNIFRRNKWRKDEYVVIRTTNLEWLYKHCGGSEAFMMLLMGLGDMRNANNCVVLKRLSVLTNRGEGCAYRLLRNAMDRELVVKTDMRGIYMVNPDVMLVGTTYGRDRLLDLWKHYYRLQYGKEYVSD